MPPSIWLRMPSGLTASPLSTAATARTTRTRPLSRSTSTSHRDRAYAAEILVAREGEAAPRPRRARTEPPQPKRSPRARRRRARAGRRDGAGGTRPDRLCAAMRELVHEALDREHVHVRAERAQRRHAQRHRRNEVMHDARVAEPCRAESRCGRRRRPAAGSVSGGGGVNGVCEMPRRQPDCPPGRAASIACCSTLVLPVDDVAALSSRACALVTIAEPYGSHVCSSSRIHCTRTGRPGNARGDQRGVGAGVVGAVVTVAAGAFHVDAAHALFGGRRSISAIASRSG